MVKGLVKFETACTMIKKTKYVDASPSERIEGRLLPSDRASLAGLDFRNRPALARHVGSPKLQALTPSCARQPGYSLSASPGKDSKARANSRCSFANSTGS